MQKTERERERESETMSKRQDDLGLLLSFQDGVLETPLGFYFPFASFEPRERGFYLKQTYTSQRKGREKAKAGIADNALLFGKKHVWYSIHHLNGKEEVPPSHGGVQSQEEGVRYRVDSTATTQQTQVLKFQLLFSGKVVCHRKLPSEEQIKDLLRKKNFKEAISLVEDLECEGELSKDMLSFVHAQVGFLLHFDLHFEEAVNHFLQSETMQPSEVFPFIMRDPNRCSLLVPRNRYWGLHPPLAPLEDVIDDGLMAIQRAIFLRKAGVETVVDDAFLLNPPSRDNLLESAIKSITRRYLEASREKELTPSVKEGVDTLLMFLYRALNNAYDMEKLASSTNSCVVECQHCSLSMK
ncbi:hypothetical protein ACFX2I_036167 [Malus domestica]